MQHLTVAEVEYVACRLARDLGWDEPIPEFGSRFPNVLEGCLVAPFQTFSGRSLYRGLVGKAAILFYLMVKNHPFQNGNKRLAMTTLLYFLHRNGKWLRADNQTVYNFAKWVAASDPRFKEEVISAIEKFIRIALVRR